jgi:phasin
MRETNTAAGASKFPAAAKMGTPHAVHEVTTQAKESYEKMSAAATEASSAVQSAYSTAARGAMECNAKAIEFARINSNAAFDYATELLGAKSPAEFLELSAQHARKQFAVLSEQAKELTALSQKTMREAAEPFQAGAAKMFQTPTA